MRIILNIEWLNINVLLVLLNLINIYGNEKGTHICVYETEIGLRILKEHIKRNEKEIQRNFLHLRLSIFLEMRFIVYIRKTCL